MHFLIVKNAYRQNAPHKHSKLCPCHCPLLLPPPSHPPLPPKPHTTTLEIIQAYIIQIIPRPTPRAQIKKYTCLLKFNFVWGLLYTKFCQKNYSPPNPPFNTREIIKKITLLDTKDKLCHFDRLDGKIKLLSSFIYGYRGTDVTIVNLHYTKTASA